MKNFGLFLFLISLITLTYYLEEVQNTKEVIVQTEKKRLFKEFSQIDRIETRSYKVVKKESWTVENLNYPASNDLLGNFIHIIENINIISEVNTEKEDNYFKQNNIPFIFFVGERRFEYVLGDVSSLTGNFYIKSVSDGKIYLCQDDSRFTGNYQSDLDRKLKKYIRIRSILMGTDDLFIERKLFYHLDINAISKIKIDSKHNRWFELDLEQNTSNPPKYPLIKYKDFSKTIGFFMQNIMVKKLITGGQNILSNPVSELLLIHKGEEVHVKLYAGLNGNYGHYAKFKNLSYIFELDENSSQLFHTHVQDFWDKKFLLDINFKSIDGFEYELSFDKNIYYRFAVEDLEKFEIKTLSPQVSSINNNLMNFVFNLIFNLVDFKEAKYLEQISQMEKAQLYIKIFKREFGISILDGKIEVIDYIAMIKYHFNYNTQQLKTDTIARIFTVMSK